MTTESCVRLWEVEAARDGRLSGAALEAFERHIVACESCKRERDALVALARVLGEAETVEDEVALRRSREVILAQAAAQLLDHGGERFGRRSLYIGAVAAAAIVLIATGVGLGFGSARGKHGSVVVTEPEGDATWIRQRDRDFEQIYLSDGVLSVSIQRLADDPRVVVHVPEGEIEDLGTIFRVSVRDHRTLEIRVNQGVVVFRRKGQPDLRLSAGTTWSPIESPRAAVQALPAPTPAIRLSAAMPSSTRARTERFAERAHGARAGGVHGVLKRATHPSSKSDSTAEEDAAYLQVLALLREGRRDEARIAAARYLSKFPSGFRRVEVERIAWPPTPR